MQESMHAQIKHTPMSKYIAGQHMWLSTHSWQPQVLEAQWIGPFEIQEVLHNACRLRLLSTIKVHPVVNIMHLKPISEVPTSDPHQELLANPANLAEKK